MWMSLIDLLCNDFVDNFYKRIIWGLAAWVPLGEEKTMRSL